MTQSLPEIVEARRRLQEKLKAIGVTTENYDEVVELLEQYQSSDLEQARHSQFRDTAYDMLAKISSASTKNTDKLSRLLREFAEYVTQQVLHPKANELGEIVDAIPEMGSGTQEENED